ncbi:MAG: hypothetical protein QM811_19900 [Pirellulales bacterium]
MMTVPISPQQLLCLWSIAVERPGSFMKNMAYSIDASQRKQLEARELIRVSKGLRGALIAELTPQAWDYLRTNLSSDLALSAKASRVLQRFLMGFHERIVAGDATWPNLVSACRGFPAESAHAQRAEPAMSAAATVSGNVSAGDLRSRIYDACRRILGDGVYSTRIRLADLRRSLPDLPRDAVDHALRDLERRREGSLMPLDDPREIAADDEAAAISNSSGRAQHVLYLSRR